MKITIINILVIISTIAFTSYSNAGIQVKRKLDIDFNHININPSVAAPDLNSGTEVSKQQECVNKLSDRYGDGRFGDTEQNFIDFCSNAFFVEENFNELCLEATTNLASDRSNFLHPIVFGDYNCTDKSFTYDYVYYRNNNPMMFDGFFEDSLTGALITNLSVEFYNVVSSKSEYKIYE